MEISIKKITLRLKWWIQDLKRLPKATYLCWRYPFLRFWNRKNKFFQTSCWYYCIPDGWRKAFGMQVIQEINESLLQNGGRKLVKSYTISDIKEKFGELCWYDDGAPVEVHNIISKYSYISRFTCITCGKPAHVRTTGWICPYCEDCVGDKICIHFGHSSWNEWYGWSGNIWNVPKDVWEAEEELLKRNI